MRDRYKPRLPTLRVDSCLHAEVVYVNGSKAAKYLQSVDHYLKFWIECQGDSREIKA